MLALAKDATIPIQALEIEETLAHMTVAALMHPHHTVDAFDRTTGPHRVSQGRAARLGAVWTGSAGVVRVQFQRFPRARVAGPPVCALSRSRLLMRLSGPTPRRVLLPLCLSAWRYSRRQRPRGQAGTRSARPAASALPPVSAADVPSGQTGPHDPLLYQSLQLHHPVNGGEVGAERGTPGLKAEEPADADPTSH